MIKKIVVLLLIFQFNSALAQKTLEEIVDEIPFDENFFSPCGYFDRAGEVQGLLIQDKPQILKQLELEPLDHGEYYLIGKYEINNSTVLFLTKYWETEDIHFAILVDESFKPIDRLDETAYENAEGFYNVTTDIDYNIITTTTYNSYRNPNYLYKKYTITDEGFKAIEDEVIVELRGGTRFFDEPTTNSVTLTWANQTEVFRYLSSGYKLDSISVASETQLKDYWLKVAKKDSIGQIGYVFGAFAKRQIRFSTNEYDVSVNEISEEEFQVEEIKKPSEPVIEKITNVDEIEKLLDEQLVLAYNTEYDYHEIKGVTTDNGKEINLYWSEYGVSAYYPKYHYLLLEGGHSSEYIIDLKTGKEDINRIGNPDYYLSSPLGSFRLNGFYSGQSNIHFLEKNNENGEPEYLFSMSSLLSLDFIEKYFWKNDSTIFLKVESEYYSIELLHR